jgi:small Trp-rich protein
MPIIILIVALSILRYLEIWPVADLSWWWIGGLFLLALLWFEYFERILGLDKRRAHEALEKARRERVESTFKRKK